MPEPVDYYLTAVAKLEGEGFVLDPKTCFFVQGAERLRLRWNGKVYARGLAQTLPQLEPVYTPSPEPIVAGHLAFQG